MNKTFGTIPTLYVSEPFSGDRYLSQLALTYAASYFLGMLVRYYPTHWVALVQGEKGDTWWPTLNRAQNMIEIVYPELVVELIHDIIDLAKKERAVVKS